MEIRLTSRGCGAKVHGLQPETPWSSFASAKVQHREVPNDSYGHLRSYMIIYGHLRALQALLNPVTQTSQIFAESFPRFLRRLRENIFFVLSVSFDVYGIKLETLTLQLEPEFTFELLSPSYGSPSVSNMSLTCCGVSTLDFGTHPVRMRSSFNVSARSKSLAKRRRAGR